MLIEYYIQDVIKTNFSNIPISTNKNNALNKDKFVYIYKYLHEIDENEQSEIIRIQINVISNSYKESETISNQIYNLFNKFKFDFDVIDILNNVYKIAKINTVNKPIFADIINNNKYLFNFNLQIILVRR